MIELVLADRCNDCGACIEVCPTNVFEPGPAGPVIALQDACQTCFLCELYCRQDALYVGPSYDPAGPVSAEAVLASGLLGQYRRDSGWHEWRDHPEHQDQHFRMGEIFARARAMADARAKSG